MKEEKSQYFFRQILDYLLKHEVVSTQKIADEIGLSEKTVRVKLDGLEEYLKQNRLGDLVRKPRVGIWLKVDDSQRTALTNVMLNDDSTYFMTENDDRVALTIKRLLRNVNGNCTTTKLAADLYLSAPTMLKVIKEAENRLAKFNITVKRVRNKGLELDYTESNYRFALKSIIIQESNDEPVEDLIHYFMPGIDSALIRKTILETENEWGVEFTDGSFIDLLILVCCAVYRNSIAKSFATSAQEIVILERHNEYAFAQAIFSRLSKSLQISISQNEVAFLSIQILCSKVIGNNVMFVPSKYVQEYDNNLEIFAEKLIDIVGNILNVDLSKDTVLYQGLLSHLRPTIFRLRYGRSMPNSLVHTIKSEYKQVFRSVWAISVLFEEYYNLKVTEDELGYIVLYIQAAVERKEHPLHVVLASHLGMSHNQLLCERVRKNFPDIQDIEVVTLHEFKIDKFAHADVILTTGTISVRDPRIIEIDHLLTQQGVHKLKMHLMTITLLRDEKEPRFDSRCHQLFEPDLIFTHLKVNNKEELLKILTSHLVRKGYVTRKYHSTVLERETATSTSDGNRVAIPHGNQNEINEAKVVIATLDHPIRWYEEDDVDVVFLLAVKMTSQEETEITKLFYKQYIKLVETDETVEILRKFNNNIDFYKFLIR